jgi:hypothetical protein
MMRKIIWINYAGNEAVLQTVNEKINILHTVKRKEGNWIGHICSMKLPSITLTEKIERKGIRGKRHQQLVDNVTETRRYWKLKQEAARRTLWITRF